MTQALPALLCSLLARAGHGALCDPGYLEAVARAELHVRGFDGGAAIAAYREALLRDPGGFHALRGLAEAWNERGATLSGPDAEDAFSRALGYAQCLEEAFPASPEGPSLVAASYGQLTAGASPGEKVSYSREIAGAARRALARDPDFVPALLALGAYERELSRLGFFARVAVQAFLGGAGQTSLAESERLLRRAVELAPGSLVAHHELGLTLLAEKDEAGAARAFRAALERAPAGSAQAARQIDAAARLARLEP
jgi:tetratricopeptide (TPR) repeat protein